MSRRWSTTPLAENVPYTPPEDCCFDATDVQSAIDQMLMVGKLVSIKLDGDGVVAVCDLMTWKNGDLLNLMKAST